METIGPNTRPIMMLLLFWLWVLLFGPSVYGSPLELQMLEMMLREAEGYPSNGRDQRDISVLPAASIDCDDKDDSLMQAASINCDESGSQEQLSNIFDDDSEECLDFLEPCEPSFEKGLPVEHPCFVRLLLLRTPLLREDPCANFSLAAEITKTTKKPKRKCNPKGNRAEGLSQKSNVQKNSTECAPVEPTTCSPEFMADSPINSSTSSPLPETKPTPKRIKLKKLVPKNRKLKANSTSSTTPSTISTTTDPTEVKPDSKIIYIRKDAPKNRRLKPNSTTSTTTTTTTTTTTAKTTTAEETTMTEEPSTTTEDPTTTTEQDTTTAEYSTTPYPTTQYPTTSKTTPKTTTTTERPLTENQLKRLKAAQIRRRNRKGYAKGTPKVPDPPKIKIDGATQPSEVIHVILPTDAAEMRLTPEEDSITTVMPTTPMTTSTSEPETTTDDSCEDEVETTKLPEFPESEDAEGEASDRSESKGGNSMEEPCEDTEEQDTNLCPQFMPAQRQSNSPRRPPIPFRYRKPVKNYVEPILYEGNIAKPLHRPARMRLPQKDYFISNKQIVPRPRPKYRKRLPHSIYMNNIVRGLDCVDPVDHHPSQDPTQSQRYWDLRRVGPGQRLPSPERNLRSFAPVPARRLLSHPESTEESDDSQYQREIESEPHSEQLRYPEDEEAALHEERPMPAQAMPTPSMDPCQVEHDHALFAERREHPGDYPQTPASSHFFT